jgi:hypothetical protein
MQEQLTRLDEAPVGGAESLPGPAGDAVKPEEWDDVRHLLRLIRERAKPARRERRRTKRYPAAEHRAWIGWRKDDGEYSVFAAKLIDVSRGGARLSLAEPPPTNHRVWLWLGAPKPVDYVQATTLDVKVSPENEYDVRVEFHSACPKLFYQVAVHGQTPATARAAARLSAQRGIRPLAGTA